MAHLNITVNGRPYAVGCEDGQEGHLMELGRLFDRQVRQVSQDMGQLGETRLFLMGALLLADELSDLRLRLSAVQAELAQTKRSGNKLPEDIRKEFDSLTAAWNAAMDDDLNTAASSIPRFF